MVRTATYIHQIPTAIEMIQDAHEKGYETTANIMAIAKVREDELCKGIELLAESDVDVIYLVDSFGAFYPEQIRRLTDMYMNIAEKHGKKIGIHAHNNQQLAFANTIEATARGVSYLDATMMSMGRGAGNCAMEALLGFLRNPKYNVYPVIQFIEKHMGKLREEGAVWGYDLQYLMTGLLNQHPRAAIQFTNDNRTDYSEFYKEVIALD